MTVVLSLNFFTRYCTVSTNTYYLSWRKSNPFLNQDIYVFGRELEFHSVLMNFVSRIIVIHIFSCAGFDFTQAQSPDPCSQAWDPKNEGEQHAGLPDKDLDRGC